MPDCSVVVEGVPSTYNPVKIKLLFEAECKVAISSVTISGTKATVQLAQQSDRRHFCDNLPKSIKFGNKQYCLSVIQDGSQHCKREKTDTPAVIPKRRKKKNGWNYSKAQTWYSLQQLPDIKSGILVQPSCVSISPDDIRNYFENNQLSCGGQILDMIPMIDGIFISFCDEKVAKNIWEYRPHRVCGKPVQVFLKIVPLKFSHKYIIESKEYSEDELESTLKDCANDKEAEIRVKKNSSGKSMITFDASCDEHLINRTFDSFREKNPDLKSDCIKVTSIPNAASDEEFRILLESSGRGSGGCVTKIYRHRSDTMTVHFASYKDAETITEKFKGKTLPFLGSNMKIRPFHFSSMGDDESSDIHLYYKTWLQAEDGASTAFGADSEGNHTKESLCFEKVDEDILKFFLVKTEHIQQLSHMLKDTAGIRVSESGFQINLKTNFDQSKIFVQIEHFLQNFTVKKLDISSDTDVKTVDSCIANNSEDVTLRWEDRKKTKLVIVGLRAKVESFAQTMAVDQNSINLSEDVIRWFERSGVLTKLRKTHPCIGRCEKTEIHLIGNASAIQTAEFKITSLYKKLHYIPCRRQSDFLKRCILNDKKLKKLENMLIKEEKPVTFIIDDNAPTMLVLQDDSEAALAILECVLIVDETIEVPAKVSTSQDFRKFMQDINIWGTVMMTLKTNVLSVVGFVDDVNQIKDQLSQFDVKFKSICSMEKGVAKHILCPEVGIDIHKLQKSHQIELEIVSDGILIKGKKESVEKASEILKKLTKNVKKQVLHCAMHGVTDFIATQEYINMLDNVRRKYLSTVTTCALQQERGATNSSKSSLGSISDWPSTAIGSLKVTIRKGDITEETNDALLNSISPKLDLRASALSKAYLEKAGDEIQKELRASKSKPSKVFITKAGKLKCKIIVHVIFPLDDLATFDEVFSTALWKIDEKKCYSLSIPAVCTGHGKLPSSTVAELIFKSVHGITQSKRRLKNLRIIDIVLNDPSHFSDFVHHITSSGSEKPRLTAQEQFKSHSLRAVSSRTQLSNQCLKIGSLVISVRQGDITNEENDAIVNSVGSKFSLSKGMVSQTILKKGGKSIQEEVWSKKDSFVRVTGSGKLRCKKIIHVVAPDCAEKVECCIIESLYTADAESCQSLSVPAIGTGKLGYSISDVAQIMLDSIRKFATTNPGLNTLQIVDIVIYDDKQFREFHGVVFGGQDGRKTDDCCPDMAFSVYSMDENKANKACQYIRSVIAKELESSISLSACLPLDDEKQNLIRNCCNNANTKIVKFSSDEVIIEGLKVNCETAKAMMKTMLEKQQSIVVPIVWESLGKDNRWLMYSREDSFALEEAYQKSAKSRVPEHEVELGGKKRRVNFQRKSVDNKFSIRRTHFHDKSSESSV